MKATNIVKHSNIVDREKRSEALGTGKLFLLRSFFLSPHSEPTPPPRSSTTPYQPNPTETLNIPLTNECADRYITNRDRFFFHLYFFTKVTAGPVSYIMSKI